MKRKILLLLAFLFICNLSHADTTYKMRYNAFTSKLDWVVDGLSVDDIVLTPDDDPQLLFDDNGFIGTATNTAWNQTNSTLSLLSDSAEITLGAATTDSQLDFDGDSLNITAGSAIVADDIELTADRVQIRGLPTFSAYLSFYDTAGATDGELAFAGDIFAFNDPLIIQSTVAGALTIGTSTAATDYILKFDGETSDGLLTWMEDEDYFTFADEVRIEEELTIVLPATGIVTIDASGTRTGAQSVMDIVVTDINTTSASSAVLVIDTDIDRDASDTGITAGFSTNIETGDMANGTYSAAYWGFVDSTNCATLTSDAIAFYAPNNAFVSASANDYAFYAGSGFDAGLRADSPLWLEEITIPTSPPDNVGALYAKDSAGVAGLYWQDTAGTETDLLAGGGATAYDDIGDPDANSSIDFGSFTNTWTNIDTYTLQSTAATALDVILDSTDTVNLYLDKAAASDLSQLYYRTASASIYFGLGTIGTEEFHLRHFLDLAAGDVWTFDTNGAAGEITASSGIQNWIAVKPVINQTSTAGYNAILVDVTETSTGSGAKNLMDLQVGSTSQFAIDNSGNVITAGGSYLSSNSGVITLGGSGGANNEDLTFDFETTADKVILGTTTGTATIDYNTQAILMRDNNPISLGTGTDSAIRWATSGNDHVQIYTTLGTVNDSGYITLVELADRNNANRAPSTTAEDPTFRIYSSDATDATQYGDLLHDQTSFVIGSGTGFTVISGDTTTSNLTADDLITTGTATIGSFATIGGSNARITFVTNGEKIENMTDDMIDFVGLSGDNNTDIRMDLDGPAPVFSSPTDDYLGFSDGIRVGDGGTTDYTEITADGTVRFVGKAGVAFAGISAISKDAETTITTAGVPVQVTVFDVNSHSHVLIPDHTNDHVTVINDGAYYISSSLTLNSVSGSASRAVADIQKNNGASVLAGGMRVGRNITGGGGSSASLSMCGFVNLSADDTVEVWIENETNTQNYIIEDITLNVQQVGGGE